MLLTTSLLLALLHGGAADTSAAPAAVTTDSVRGAQAGPVLAPRLAADTDTVVFTRRRPRAVEVSDAYATRLRIHQVASYFTIPLFVAQTVAGEQLYKADQGGQPRPGWAKSLHSGGAVGLGALFTVNTVTGVWNLWESRDQPVGRGRRLLHSALMLASDAGFAYTGAVLAEEAKESSEGRNRHRRAAYVSLGTALAGYGVMLFGNH